jgi:sulfate/thiosulfate-binding protein
MTTFPSVFLTALLLCGGLALGSLSSASTSAAAPRELVLAAYSVPKEAYEQRIIPGFQRYWKGKTGQQVTIRSSYGASGAQARSVIGGFEADVVALSLEGDVEQLTKAGLVTHNWRQDPHKGMITASVVALGVRKGNPKGIRGWEDLGKPGIALLYPNPKTSGGAMWDVIAIYGAGLKLAAQAPGKPEPEAYAEDLLRRMQRNVKVMDKSGRESVTTFERGVGDVIITYENELLPRIKSGRPYEVIVPAETVWVENPVTLVDRNVQRHGVQDLAEAFVAYLHSDEARQAFVELGFRLPDQPAVGGLARPAQLFTIAELGGWTKIQQVLFGPEGIWTKVVEEVGRER